MIDKASRIVRNKLFTLGRVRRYEQGKIVLRKGEAQRAAMFVLSGEIAPSVTTSPIYLVELLEGEKISDDVKTMLPTEILLVPREKFLQLMKSNVELACLVIDELLKHHKENSMVK
jgi:CRP-like cAMP-binding protein